MTSKFKSSLFGYKKTDVLEYIAELSQNLEKKHKDELDKLKGEILQLKNQLEAEKNVENKVAKIIIEAQNFAEKLKEKAIRENDELVRQNEESAKKTEERIKDCNSRISAIIESISKIALETTQSLNNAKEEIDSIDLSEIK